MRGDELIPDDMFSYVRPEQRVPADHPLRPIRTLVDEVLRALSPRFARLYAKTGRPSIPPEKLLRALLPRRCTRSAASVSSWSSWTSTSCIGGSSD
jgi:hypothetical protein